MTERAFGFLRLATCVGLLMLGVAPAAAHAALSSTPDKDWVTNGSVDAIARSGNTIYLGGSFTEVGPRTGPAVTFSGGSSSPDTSFPEVAGGRLDGGGSGIDAAVSDGAGGWYIGGSFTHVGGVPRTGLAHVEAGGTVDPNFDPSLDVESGSSVMSLARVGTTLYVGGAFFELDGQSRDGLAAVNASDGSLQPWDPSRSPTNEFTTMASAGETLYVGGRFSELDGQPREDLAAFATTTGALESWSPSATSEVNAQPLIIALATAGSTIYIGGAFDHVDGAPRNGLAAVSSTGALASWDPAASGCGEHPAATIETLAATEQLVYVGGCFTHIGGQPRAGLAALDPATATATSWNPQPKPPAGELMPVTLGLALSGSTVYVTGSFGEIGGQVRHDLAALEAGTGITTPWNPNPNGRVLTLAATGSQAFVGGSFTSTGGVVRHGLAALNANTGEATSWNPNVEPTGTLEGASEEPDAVKAITLSGSTVYVGGSFSSVGGQPRRDLAAIEASNGSPTGWSPEANKPVFALLANGATVYVGGNFTSLGGSSRAYLGAVSSSTGAATSWSPSVTAASQVNTITSTARAVSSLVLSGSSLYFGGDFTSVDGQGRTSLAAVDTTTSSATSWSPLFENALFGGQEQYVAALALSGSRIWVVGSVVGAPEAIDATTGELTPWETEARGEGLAVANSSVYLGGSAADADSGLVLDWTPQINNAAVDVAYGNYLYVGGSFTGTETTAASGFAAFKLEGPINTSPPTITGAAAEGQTLTEHHATWSEAPTSYAYQWLRCSESHLARFHCTPIAGATQPTYTATEADAGQVIEVEETATNSEGTSNPAASPPTTTTLTRPSATSPPSITGEPHVGQTLTCSPGSWTGNPTSYAYTWLRDSEPIPDASSSTYVITQEDSGQALQCEVTATNAAGSGRAVAFVEIRFSEPQAEGSAGTSQSATSAQTNSAASASSTPAVLPAIAPPPTAVPAGALAAALTAALSLRQPPTILALLKASGYSLSFTAPEPGTLTIQWTTTPRRGGHASRTSKPTVIASGSKVFSAPGRATIRLRLTTAGRALLKQRMTLPIVQMAAFKPVDGVAQPKQVALRIRAGSHR